jgi:hypothetical protein
MNQSVTIESLLVLGIGAIATGIERMDVNILLGVVLTVVGAGLIGLRYFLKSKE